ncbi:efflux RND transporter periplasmic adaptor subunit [Novilysobacter selenitireducens]|uniref:Efflux RND transporter periplasmic adaptor subunit n=1 Tax=Novilysobacter selenitireducens TaxID=2872639 RepID=A0ABS7T2R9_9GAMM|nr:efflux RND transporter periplasmic adaptor subunit [Lysobacter selenitireducens]MBZ4038161.1 efflux RND transporter periplasmic adaptor subunit [Lysobacter selenitireducens]
MKHRPLLVAGAVLVLLALAWGVAIRLRGPAMEGYEVVSRPLVQTVVATGRVVAVSRAQVGSAVTGVVVERRVQEGDTVQPGDVLAVLRADDLEAAVREAEAAVAGLRQSARPQAQAAVREAEARLAQASRGVQRRRELFARQLIAHETLEQAVQAETVARTAAEQARLAARSLAAGNPDEAAARARLANARAQLAKTTLRAEVAGTVLTRNVEPGDLVQPGRVLFEIARAGATEVLVPLDEKNLQVLAIGQKAVCIADAYPSRPFPAEVSFIAPSVDPQRGSVDIRLTVSPVPDFLRQDMTVSVNVETGRRDRAVVVPNDALGEVAGDSAWVWRVEDGRAVRRDVELGLRGLTLTEVAAGLAPGDWILADAQAGLAPGDRVRVVPAGLPVDASASSTRNELPARLD